MRCVLYSCMQEVRETHVQFVERLCEQMGRSLTHITMPNIDSTETLEEDVDILFISCRNNKKELQRWLNACRELRIPYVFLTDTMKMPFTISHILLPVSMLEEEVHKAQFGVHIARFTGAQTTLLQANDYGSKAEKNVQKIQTLYDKFEQPYSIERAQKDSFSIVKEIADRQKELKQDLSIITASREYGLDDLLFGPVERYALVHSLSPVMLVNPRGDLFALCD